MAEEDRLFYVAISRAKKDLYLLTETGRESGYIERLGLLPSGRVSAFYPETGGSGCDLNEIPF